MEAIKKLTGPVNGHGEGNRSKSVWIQLDRQTKIYWFPWDTIMVLFAGEYSKKRSDCSFKVESQQELTALIADQKEFSLEITVPITVSVGQEKIDINGKTFVFFENFDPDFISFSDFEGSIGVTLPHRKTVLKIKKRPSVNTFL